MKSTIPIGDRGIFNNVLLTVRLNIWTINFGDERPDIYNRYITYLNLYTAV